MERDRISLFRFGGLRRASFTKVFQAAIGATLKGKTQFPIEADKDKKRISPNSTQETFTDAFPNEGITKALGNLMKDPQYKVWRDVRNVLAHRVSPQLTQYIGSPTPPQWEIESGVFLGLDRHLTNYKREWLAKTSRGLLQAANTFTGVYLGQ